MKFKLRIQDIDETAERIEEFDSDNLYLMVGSRKPKPIVFHLKEETKEEFERFGKALVENYNRFSNPINHRKLVEVIVDV